MEYQNSKFNILRFFVGILMFVAVISLPMPFPLIFMLVSAFYFRGVEVIFAGFILDSLYSFHPGFSSVFFTILSLFFVIFFSILPLFFRIRR